jgi:iron complex outermembrane receptor protein
MGAVYGAPVFAQADPQPAAPADPQADPAIDPVTGKPIDRTKSLGTVVVAGIRASLEQSLSVKREASSHVEVITSEDVGKMPDKNIADSLMRVPGVTTSSAGANEGGFDEKDRVSMRGTNPSLTQTLINGHQVASGDWFVLNQSGTVGRSVSYTLLPSELVGKVVVHKSSEASLVEGGVAGSVDVITRKPLEFTKDFTAEASVGMVYADKPDTYDPQFSALMNWKNDADNLGIMVQAFSEDRHLRRDGVEVLGYEQFSPTGPAAAAHPDLANVWYPDLIGSALFEQERKRTGGLVEIQFRPSDDFSIDLSAFSSKLKAPNHNRNYLFWGSRIVGDGRVPDPGYVVRNGTLVSAQYPGVPGKASGVYDQISRPDAAADSSFIALDMDWRASDALSFTGKFGRTEGHGKSPTQDVTEWDIGTGGPAQYSLHGVDEAASFSFPGTDNAARGAATLDWIFGLQNIDVKDEEKWAQLDGQYDFGDGTFTHLKFGVRWSEHERSLADVVNQGPLDGAFVTANQPAGTQNYPSNFGNGLGSGFPDDVWYFSPDQLAQFDAAYTNRDPTQRHYYQAEYALKETNTAGYLQLDFEGERWSGNVGVRVVKTKEHIVDNVDAPAGATGAVTGSLFGAYVPVTFDNDFNDVLPSANLRFELSDDTVLRFAASKTMTRADYSALAGNLGLSPPAVVGGVGSGSASNPDLKPVRSTNFDVSYEWYFAPEALLSVSAFYMDLTSYIVPARITQTFMTFQPPFPATGAPVDYVLSSSTNSSGSVKGVEFAWQQPLFDNFGINANYTYADGKEEGGRPLVGTSKNTYNVGAYYETDRFNARLNYSYRSDFFSGLDRATAFSQAAVGNLAGSLGYKFSDNISVSFDALNLNNPTLRYYALNKDQPRSIYQSGRQYYLSLRLKF